MRAAAGPFGYRFGQLFPNQSGKVPFFTRLVSPDIARFTVMGQADEFEGQFSARLTIPLIVFNKDHDREIFTFHREFVVEGDVGLGQNRQQLSGVALDANANASF